MALTIEDGTGVVGANSYATLTEIRTFATDRGATLPSGDSDLEALAHRAIEYLESYRSKFKGSKTYDGLGYLQWPREDVEIDGYFLEATEVPQLLKDAQCQLCIELQTVDPFKTTSGQVVNRERMGNLEIQYAVNYKAERELPAYIPKVDAFLEPLCRPASGLRVTRI